MRQLGQESLASCEAAVESRYHYDFRKSSTAQHLLLEIETLRKPVRVDHYPIAGWPQHNPIIDLLEGSQLDFRSGKYFTKRSRFVRPARVNFIVSILLRIKCSPSPPGLISSSLRPRNLA